MKQKNKLFTMNKLIWMYRLLKNVFENQKQAIRYFKVKFKRNIVIGSRVSIGKNCSFSGNIEIGKNVTFVGNNHFTGEVIIGSNVIFAANSIVNSRNHDFDENSDALPYGTKYITKKIIIEDNVWLGNNTIVLPGVRISEGAIVGAGSVVTKDVEYCTIVGGNPARELKKRNIERYELIKKRGVFLNDIRGFEYYSFFERLRKKKKLANLFRKNNIVYDFELDENNPFKSRRILYNYSLNRGTFNFNNKGVYLKRFS